MDNADVKDGGIGNRGENQKSIVIPVVEEHLHIGTSLVETSRVHVSKKVIEEPYDANISVLREEVTVEKKSINQLIEGEPPAIRQEGSTTIIPVIKEVVVKRLFLIEEIHVTKHQTEHTLPVHERLRREEISIERSSQNEDTDATNNSQ
jgi:uncharacterized protein (TIGR02271 family)